jgi:hypothetical protein
MFFISYAGPEIVIMHLLACVLSLLKKERKMLRDGKI